MKRAPSCTLGFIAAGMIALAAGSAWAATAVGPYYANPSWDQTLPVDTRFIVLSNMGSNAVLDRETGLVWEKLPSTTPLTWFAAQFHCIDLNVGGRTGWRLPTIQELMSLVDRSVASGLRLPSGHPFSTVTPDGNWSATTLATPTSDTGTAWGVLFSDGSLFDVGKSFLNFVWCVRGGQGVDPQ